MAKLTRSECGKLGAAKSRNSLEASKARRQLDYSLNPSLCGECSSPLLYAKRTQDFCSQACYGRSKVITRRGARPCEHCKNPVPWNHGYAKYCSDACYQEVRVGGFKEKFLAGLVANPGSVRYWLIRLRGHQCEDCLGTTWKDLPIPVDSHHIDGNSENNHPENLLLLCKNCHALTPNFAAKNRGNGRFKRRQRYAEGKIYLPAP